MSHTIPIARLTHLATFNVFDSVVICDGIISWGRIDGDDCQCTVQTEPVVVYFHHVARTLHNKLRMS